jgi:hypothetical protein
MSKVKTFTKKEVQRKIEQIFKKLETGNLVGKKFSLKSVIGDYKNNSRNRTIKEVLFYNTGNATKNGATWKLTYPKDKKNPEKLAKRVMEATYVTYKF